MARELAQMGPVLFTESIGLRRLKLSRDDLERVLKRLRPAATAKAATRPVPTNLSVLTPRIIPLHNRATYGTNRFLLSRTVRDWLDAPRPRVLWTYTPVTYGLEEHADATIYHCVDLLGEVNGIDARMILRAEANLAKHGATALGTSKVVVDHLKSVGFSDVEYWPNVADTSTIDAARPDHIDRVSRAIFAGRLTGDKVDYGILRATLDAGAPLAIAGVIDSEGDRVEVDALIAAGADYLGHMTLSQLGAEYWRSRVGLIPYPVNGYTAGVSPLKLYEYLSAGLSVVSTPLPEIQHLAIEGVIVENDAAQFAQAVRSELKAFSESDAQGRMGVAGDHSWDGRGRIARDLVDSHLGHGSVGTQAQP